LTLSKELVRQRLGEFFSPQSTWRLPEKSEEKNAKAQRRRNVGASGALMLSWISRLSREGPAESNGNVQNNKQELQEG